MKRMFKMVGVVTVLAVLFSMMPMSAMASSSYYYPYFSSYSLRDYDPWNGNNPFDNYNSSTNDYTCTYCDGSGTCLDYNYYPARVTKTCPICHGQGAWRLFG